MTCVYNCSYILFANDTERGVSSSHPIRIICFFPSLSFPQQLPKENFKSWKKVEKMSLPLTETCQNEWEADLLAQKFQDFLFNASFYNLSTPSANVLLPHPRNVSPETDLQTEHPPQPPSPLAGTS